jgi:membrane-bound lytic murein transglycosylase D
MGCSDRGRVMGTVSRGALIITILAVLSLSAVKDVTAAEPPVRNRRELPQTVPGVLPKQGHRGPMRFTLDIGSHELVERYIRYYQSEEGVKYLSLVMERAKPFRDHIASAIDNAGMPPELLFLPVIESAFREDAVSRSGASGLWQFMLNSIDPYPITVSTWQDDRRDFWKSTDAALHKLAWNYRVLGDWLLALAAYNCGLGRVQRAIASSGITDYWELSDKRLLPGETIHYVPKFIAASMILSYPGRYGLPVSWDPPVYWARIPLKGQVALPLLSKYAEIDLHTLERGNRELFFGVTPPSEGDYILKVPAEKADTVKRILSEGERKALMNYVVHTVGPGDTLYALASHFGVPMSLIESANSGIVPERLRIGSRLIVPVVREVGPYSAAKKNPEPDRSSFTGEHIVVSGESLWAIARLYGTTPEAIAMINGLSMTDIIHPGHRLQVPEQHGVLQ